MKHSFFLVSTLLVPCITLCLTGKLSAADPDILSKTSILARPQGYTATYDVKYWHAKCGDCPDYVENDVVVMLDGDGNICLRPGRISQNVDGKKVARPPDLGYKFDEITLWKQGVLIRKRVTSGAILYECNEYHSQAHFLNFRSALPIISGVFRQDDVVDGFGTPLFAYSSLLGRAWIPSKSSIGNGEEYSLDVDPVIPGLTIVVSASEDRLDWLYYETKLPEGLQYLKASDRHVWSWSPDLSPDGKSDRIPTGLDWFRNLMSTDGSERVFERIHASSIVLDTTTPEIESFSIRLSPGTRFNVEGTYYKIPINSTEEQKLVPVDIRTMHTILQPYAVLPQATQEQPTGSKN